MKRDGLISNSPDGTLGSFDTARVANLIQIATPVYQAAGLAPKAGLTVEDIASNQFIEPSIHL